MSAPALTRPTAPVRPADPDAGLPANALGKEKGVVEQFALYAFVVIPFLALVAVVPVVWGWGLSWLDVGLFVAFYVPTILGVTVGYHRHFTHGSFRAVRPLRVAMAAVGGMAIQGPVVQWVADHRRHHAFSDRDGDPHSPWRSPRCPASPVPCCWSTATHRCCARAPSPTWWPPTSGRGTTSPC